MTVYGKIWYDDNISPARKTGGRRKAPHTKKQVHNRFARRGTGRPRLTPGQQTSAILGRYAAARQTEGVPSCLAAFFAAGNIKEEG